MRRTPPPVSRRRVGAHTDAATTDLYQPSAILKAHLAALRGVPRFSGCRFRLIVECNIPGQGGAICEAALTEMNDVDIVCSTNHTYGVFTVPGIKPVYFARLCKLLRREGIAFYETVVSVCPFQASMTRTQLSAANMTKFEQQMRSFRYIYHVPRSLSASVQATFSGKADHENHRSTRMQDDLVLALGFGIKYAIDALCDPPFVLIRTWIDRLK